MRAKNRIGRRSADHHGSSSRSFEQESTHACSEQFHSYRLFSRVKDNVTWALLGNVFTTSLVRFVTKHRVRIITYHKVISSPVLRAHLEYLTRSYQPITAEEFIDAIEFDAPLPKAAIWVTFDDGHRSAYDLARPMLAEFDVAATLFVCPSTLDTTEPLWSDIVSLAAGLGIYPQEIRRQRSGEQRLVDQLKRVPDSQRREIVSDLRERLVSEQGMSLRVRQLTSAELRNWEKAGNSVGNHTWDHPCLNRCSPEEQRSQIAAAHEHLIRVLGHPVRLFAYPNGNWTPEAEPVLRDLDYAVGVLHDHRFTRLNDQHYRVSRLHAYGEAPSRMFRAMVSGSHSAVFGARIRAAAQSEMPTVSVKP